MSTKSLYLSKSGVTFMVMAVKLENILLHACCFVFCKSLSLAPLCYVIIVLPTNIEAICGYGVGSNFYVGFLL